MTECAVGVSSSAEAKRTRQTSESPKDPLSSACRVAIWAVLLLKEVMEHLI